jgi:hypothetical protein
LPKMPCALAYGLDAWVGLDLPDETLLAICDEPQGDPLDDPAAATDAALTSPLNFPPLAQATVPGDRIVLALEHGVPQAPTLVAAVANYLVGHGAAADRLVVLQTPVAEAGLERDPRMLLPEAWRKEVAIETHCPETQGKLALLASSHDGKPVYLNRTLLDADLVVPIGCLRDASTIGYHGRYGGLFPAFADAKTQQRFRKPAVPRMQRQTTMIQREEIDEVGWLLGTRFTVQAVPGGNGRLLKVLSGEIHEVFRAGDAEYEAAWRWSFPRRASLVLAAISGGAEQQTWENLAQALVAASKIVADGGAIALCTQLTMEPGRAVASLSQADDLEAAMKQIRREAPGDALSAIQLARAMEQAKIYLLSQLDESLVEDLGMAPMTEAADVGRLARRHESCIVLANAQYVVPEVNEE